MAGWSTHDFCFQSSVLLLISVLIWALTAIVTKEAGDFAILDQTKMFVASLLSISCVLAVLKIIMVIFRQKTDPIGKLYDEVDGGDLASRTSTTNYGSIF